MKREVFHLIITVRLHIMLLLNQDANISLITVHGRTATPFTMFKKEVHIQFI